MNSLMTSETKSTTALRAILDDILLDMDTINKSTAWRIASEKIRILLYNKNEPADPNTKTVAKFTTMHFAVIFHDINLIYDLFDCGYVVDQRQRDDSWTELMYAVRNGYSEGVFVLIMNGADVNALTSDGDSPLLIAALYGAFGIIPILINYGADINYANPGNSISALDVASRYGHINTMVILINQGAHICHTNTNMANDMILLIIANGGTSFSYANLSITSLLTQCMNQPKSVCMTKILQYTVTAHRPQLARAILRTQPNHSNDTPLHMAIRIGNNDILRLLITNPEDNTFYQHETIHTINKFGQTPLALAMYKKNAIAIDLLLDAGADPVVGTISVIKFAPSIPDHHKLFQQYIQCVIQRVLPVYYAMNELVPPVPWELAMMIIAMFHSIQMQHPVYQLIY